MMQPIHVLAALVVAFCWAANFIAVKYGLEYFPPFLLVALRFALVAALLLPFYWRRTIPLGFLLKMAFVLGFVHFSLVFGGMAYGLDIPTSVITVQLGVPFSCILSAVWFGDRLGAWRTMGLGIAFTGMMLVAGSPNVVAHTVPFLMVMAGAFGWALSNVFMKKQGDLNILEMLAWMSLLSVPQLLLLSWVVEDISWQHIISAPLLPILSIVFSAVGSTVVAYGLWYWLLKHCDVSRVAPFNLMVPFFGIAMSHTLFHDQLPPQMLAGGLITMVGVAIIVLRRPKLSILGRFRKDPAA